jgi:hypothetical protein
MMPMVLLGERQAEYKSPFDWTTPHNGDLIFTARKIFLPGRFILTGLMKTPSFISK